MSNIEDSTGALIREQFRACRKVLIALGDETRQLIISVLAENGCQSGLQVGEVTERTHLSRPAVSHHLKILLDAEVVGMRKQATKHFYYLALGGECQTLVSLMNNIERLRAQCAGEGEQQ
ncbi:transcriptional regulator [Clostridia bacterium]|nr:transcriptional regulator [Clostridia bacterium]